MLLLLIQVAKSCPALCDTMDCSTPAIPVLHYLPEFAQIHVHWVSDAIQLSHPLSPTSAVSRPISGSFPMSWLFASVSQRIGASALASVLPMNIQGWFPLGLTGLISLQSKELASVLQHNWKASILWCSAFFMVQLTHLYVTTGKTKAWTMQTFVTKVIFNMLSGFVIAFLLRSKHLLILWLQSPSSVVLEPKKTKSATVSTFSLFVLKWWDQISWSLFFECGVLSQLFHSPLSPSSRGSLVPLHFSAIRVVSSVFLRLLIFLLVILISVYDSSSLAFCMMYPACKLNKQGVTYDLDVFLSPFWN